MDVCLRVLKLGSTATVSGTVYCMIIYHITFRDRRVHIFATTFLEIAVFKSNKRGDKLASNPGPHGQDFEPRLEEGLQLELF